MINLANSETLIIILLILASLGIMLMEYLEYLDKKVETNES